MIQIVSDTMLAMHWRHAKSKFDINVHDAEFGYDTGSPEYHQWFDDFGVSKPLLGYAEYQVPAVYSHLYRRNDEFEVWISQDQLHAWLTGSLDPQRTYKFIRSEYRGGGTSILTGLGMVFERQSDMGMFLMCWQEH